VEAMPIFKQIVVLICHNVETYLYAYVCISNQHGFIMCKSNAVYKSCVYLSGYTKLLNGGLMRCKHNKYIQKQDWKA
jgi:hypothetical protein